MKDQHRGIPEFDKDHCYVLVAKEKHGTRYFDATTRKAFLKSALALLTERFKANYFYYKPDKPIVPQGMLNEEQLKGMPEGQLKNLAVKMLRDYRQACRNCEDDSETYRAIEDAVKEKDGEKAWDCLRARMDWEYEHVELKLLETG